MTGFSSQWLSLREPYDHAARNQKLQEQFLRHIHAQDGLLTLMDMGSGTGSNLRALAPLIKRDQHWILCDIDAALLVAARAALLDFFSYSSVHDDVLYGMCGAAQVKVTFQQCDLAQDIETILAQPCDMVTAAAFFDLASEAWMARFSKALRSDFYTVLTYDGREIWHPSHAADEAMLRAFHLHQASDKGMGPAAGPRAHACLKTFLAHTHDIYEGQSDWVLDTSARPLITALAEGSADAVRATSQLDENDIAAWCTAHQQVESCIIGHYDLWAPQRDERGNMRAKTPSFLMT